MYSNHNPKLYYLSHYRQVIQHKLWKTKTSWHDGLNCCYLHTNYHKWWAKRNQTLAVISNSSNIVIATSKIQRHKWPDFDLTHNDWNMLVINKKVTLPENRTMFAAVWLSTLGTLLPDAAPAVENDALGAVDKISVGTKPFRLREMFTFTNSTLRLSESFRPVSRDIGLSVSSEPEWYKHVDLKTDISRWITTAV